MCGICGIIRKDSKEVRKYEINEMCLKLIHRGPDDGGVFVSAGVGIGMRRLKIIDLETGHQPIHNEDSSIWIVFNGEIYNYLSLREELMKRGHKFYTNTDTEVLIHLYEEFDTEMTKFLNGMFSFAIFDKNRKSVFLARDRLGIKPLYIWENESQIVFSSEIKAIRSIKEFSTDIDYRALDQYFSFLYVPEPRSIYKGIKKIPKGHTVLVKAGKLQIKKYWEINYTESNYTEEEIINSTDEEISSAVRRRMISDVPLGAFLSGGIDSSIIVANMAKLSSIPVETFSIIWDKKESFFDEREYSKTVSEIYKTNHHEFLIKPNVEEVINEIIYSFDEPFADASTIPNYYLAKETRNYVTVALSGLGGDELAGGYERYLGMLLSKYYEYIPKFFHNKVISNIVNNLPDSKKGTHLINRAKRFINTADLNFLERYFSIISTYSDKEKKLLYSDFDFSDLVQSSLKIFQNYALPESISDLNRILYIDQNTYLVDDLLCLSDRISMAHSLEVRVPFLDHNLVEHFAKMNVNMKIKKLNKKYILKKIAEKYIPKDIIYRPKKGFSVPLVLWFRNELKSYVQHVLNKKSIEKTGLFNYGYINIILNEHFSGKQNHDEKIWSLIIFMLWYDKNIFNLY